MLSYALFILTCDLFRFVLFCFGAGAGCAERCGNGTETATEMASADAPEAGFADGDGAFARFDGPSGLTAAEDGTLFVADTNNHLVGEAKKFGSFRNRYHTRHQLLCVLFLDYLEIDIIQGISCFVCFFLLI